MNKLAALAGLLTLGLLQPALAAEDSFTTTAGNTFKTVPRFAMRPGAAELIGVYCIGGCTGSGGGGGAVTIADGADVAEGAVADTAWVSGNGTVVAIGKGIFGKLGTIITKQSDGTQKTQIVDGAGAVIASTSNSLNVQCANCSGSGVSAADEASFTAGTSLFAGSGGFFQTTATSNALTTGQQGMFQVTANRALFSNLRNVAGTEVGTSGAPLRTDPTGTTPEPVTQSGTWTVQPGNTANTTAWKVDGSAVTQPVSAASLPLPAGAGTAANQTAPQTPLAPAAATATKGLQLGGQYTSAGPPAFTNGQQGAVPVDQNGALNVGFDGATFAPASVTSATTIFTQDMTGYAGIGVQVTSAGSSCTITYETSEDNTNWVATTGQIVGAGVNSGTVSTSTAAGIVIFNKKARYLRARVSTYGSGTVTAVYGLHKTAPVVFSGAVGPGANLSVLGSNASGVAAISPVTIAVVGRTSNLAVTNGQQVYAVSTLAGATIVYPWSIPELTWQYAAASGGIVNSTTAVTLQGAGAAGIRNFITRLQVSANGTVATASEIVIRDGAAGTVIWRGSLPATTQPPLTVNFEPPLKSTAATLVEFATLTGMGASSAVYVNAQGFQGP